MGQLKHDGSATQGGFAAPAGQDLPFGELFRINKWNGIAMTHIGASDTARSLDLEISSERIWYIKLPAGVNPAIGAPLYWADPTAFQRGDTDLQVAPATAGDAPACKIEEVKDGNGYAAVRVLNVG